MNGRLVTLLALDARLQIRYGIYYAYAVVVSFYALMLAWLGRYLPAHSVGVVIYSDPAVLGFFFLGALMMLEKAEGARIALATTPASASDYFWSKCLSLTAIAVVAVSVIGVLAPAAPSWPVLIAATALTSIQFIGIGVPIALRFRSVTSYLIGSAGLLTPVVAPGTVALLDPMPAWAIVIPAASQLRLILVGLGQGSSSAWEIAAMFAISAAAAAGGVWIAVRSLEREFGRK